MWHKFKGAEIGEDSHELPAVQTPLRPSPFRGGSDRIPSPDKCRLLRLLICNLGKYGLEAIWLLVHYGLMRWTVVLADEFEKEFAALDPDIQLLEHFGPNLGRPNVDTLDGSSFPQHEGVRGVDSHEKH